MSMHSYEGFDSSCDNHDAGICTNLGVGVREWMRAGCYHGCGGAARDVPEDAAVTVGGHGLRAAYMCSGGLSRLVPGSRQVGTSKCR